MAFDLRNGAGAGWSVVCSGISRGVPVSGTLFLFATDEAFSPGETHPKRQFSAKVGTIFEDSPIPLEKWLVVIWMISNCRNGVSSYEIAHTIGVTQNWRDSKIGMVHAAPHHASAFFCFLSI